MGIFHSICPVITCIWICKGEREGAKEKGEDKERGKERQGACAAVFLLKSDLPIGHPTCMVYTLILKLSHTLSHTQMHSCS